MSSSRVQAKCVLSLRATICLTLCPLADSVHQASLNPYGIRGHDSCSTKCHPKRDNGRVATSCYRSIFPFQDVDIGRELDLHANPTRVWLPNYHAPPTTGVCILPRFDRFQFAHTQLYEVLIWPFRYSADNHNVYNGHAQMALSTGSFAIPTTIRPCISYLVGGEPRAWACLRYTEI